jgi:hypothetical protein
MMAVLYDTEVAALVTSNRMTAQEADKLPFTAFIPLSRPHDHTSLSPKMDKCIKQNFRFLPINQVYINFYSI